MNTQHRRKFLQQLMKGSASVAAYPWLRKYADTYSDLEEGGNDERYWKKVRKQYAIKSKYINLNNAGVNPQAKVVREAVTYYEDLSNQLPSYYMWNVLKNDRKLIKEGLADLIGCTDQDIALVRNTTEGLQTVVSGVQLKEGDEVVLSKHDYPHMKNAWKQRAKRDDLKLKWVSLELPSTDKEYLIKQYTDQMTDKTKLVCITYITNWNGQVMPLQELAKMAKSKGAEVLVDAAHAIGQRPMNIKELDVDYLASSLHKWLGAPFGTGVLYVKADKRRALYPLIAGPNAKSKNIVKFEHQGTLVVSHERSILPALVFHNSIGTERKMNRLIFLNEYIANKIKDFSGIKIQSPLGHEFGSAILLIHLEKLDIEETISELMTKYNVHCTKSENEMLSGIRISPNIYTSLSELDTFVEALLILTNK